MLTLTAAEKINHQSLTSAPLTIVVTDPPASTSGISPSINGEPKDLLTGNGDQWNHSAAHHNCQGTHEPMTEHFLVKQAHGAAHSAVDSTPTTTDPIGDATVQVFAVHDMASHEMASGHVHSGVW